MLKSATDRPRVIPRLFPYFIGICIFLVVYTRSYIATSIWYGIGMDKQMAYLLCQPTSYPRSPSSLIWAGRLWAPERTNDTFPRGRHTLALQVTPVSLNSDVGYTIDWNISLNEIESVDGQGKKVVVHQGTNPVYFGTLRDHRGGEVEVAAKVLCTKTRKGQVCEFPKWMPCLDAIDTGCPKQAVQSAEGSFCSRKRTSIVKVDLESRSYCSGPQGCGLFRDEIYFASMIAPSLDIRGVTPVLDVVEIPAKAKEDTPIDAAQMYYYALIYPKLAQPPWVNKTSWLLSPIEAQKYIFGLLIGLQRGHSLGIIHGDVQPTHTVLDPRDGTYRVIDWDGAMDVVEGAGGDPSYSRDSSKSCWAEGPVVNRGAPEIALALAAGNQKCKVTQAIDIWEVGDVIASVGFGCEKLFRPQKLLPNATGKASRLHAIINLLGTESLYKDLFRHSWLKPNQSCSHRCNELYLDEAVLNMTASVPPQPLVNFIKTMDGCNHSVLPDEDLLNLASQLLRWNPEDRLSAKEALRHPYFRKQLQN